MQGVAFVCQSQSVLVGVCLSYYARLRCVVAVGKVEPNLQQGAWSSEVALVRMWPRGLALCGACLPLSVPCRPCHVLQHTDLHACHACRGDLVAAPNLGCCMQLCVPICLPVPVFVFVVCMRARACTRVRV